MSYKTWPQRDDSREQPWQQDEPDFLPRAGLPVLTSGSADPAVHTLFSALARLGYESTVSRGENPIGVVGPEEMAAVRQFRADYNVQEDPTLFGGNNDASRVIADQHIGPWTGEAILRASEHLDRNEETDELTSLKGRLTRLEKAQADAKPPAKTTAAKAGAKTTAAKAGAQS